MNRVGDKGQIPVVVTKMVHCHRGNAPCATLMVLPLQMMSTREANISGSSAF